MKTLSVAPILSVHDLERAVRFYADVLGFTEEFRVPGSYAGVKLDAVTIHLSADVPVRKAAGSGHVYIFCDEVDSYCQSVASMGAKILCQPADEPYGMRDFVVEDPDGNYLVFGSEIEHS